MKDTQWYVEANGLANENICEVLRAAASGVEPESVALVDTKGGRHAVLRIPFTLLTRIKQMKREQPQIYRNAKFWVQHIHDGPITDASFIEKRGTSKAVQSLLTVAASKAQRRGKVTM